MSNVHTLLVVWQNQENRSYYHIGTLSYYNNQYEFIYTDRKLGQQKLGDALENNYMPHPAFPNLDKVYQSKMLFPAFDRRIPSSDRLDFKLIIADLGLNDSSSKMDLLQETRGRLASDNYSFEQPLRLEEDGKLYSSFFVHGMRHRDLPEHWPTWISNKSILQLRLEPTNEFDSHAVGIYTYSGKHIGYIPRFYSTAIFSLIKNGAMPSVHVTSINEKSTPHWWVKVEVSCEIPKVQGANSDELLTVMQ